MSLAATSHVKQQIGAPVDDFTLTAIGGVETSLPSILKGKRGAVVVFWSGVCSHCGRYDGYLNSFAGRRPDIALIGLASRHGETESHIRNTMEERNLSFPILHDPAGKVAKAWFTQQTPRVFLIDVNRIILNRGDIDNFKYPEDPEHIPYLEPAIDEFLAGHPVTRNETASFGCAIQSVYYNLPKAL